MRTIDPMLRAAQRAWPARRPAVWATLSRRGQLVGSAATWSELSRGGAVAYDGVIGAAGLSDGGALRAWCCASGAVMVQRVTDVASAQSWSETVVVQVAANAIAVMPGISVDGGDVRLYYGATAGEVYAIRSSDGGATWSTPARLWASGWAAVGGVAARWNGEHHIVVVELLNGSTPPVHRLFAGYDDGSGLSDVNQGPAGRTLGGLAGGAAGDLVIAGTPVGTGDSALWAHYLDGHTWIADADLLDVMRPDGVFEGVRAGDCLAAATVVLVERMGLRGYVGVAGVWDEAHPAVMDEPVIHSLWPARSYQPITVVGGDVTNGAGGTTHLLVSTDVVYIATELGLAQPVDLPAPVRYRYDTRLWQGGELEAVWPARYRERFRPGELLTIERGYRVGGARATAGRPYTEGLAFRIRKVTWDRGWVVVTGYDWMGETGAWVARRSRSWSSGDALLQQIARAICARAGVRLDISHGAAGQSYSPSFSAQAAENGLSALFRLLRLNGAFLVNQEAGLHLQARSRWVDDEYGGSGHPVIKATRVRGTVSPSQAIAIGENGALPAWSIIDALWHEQLRPKPVILQDPNLTLLEQVDATAEAEAARLASDSPAGWIRTVANIGLEIGDVLSLTDAVAGWVDEAMRVQRIVETWSRGSLEQEVYLGVL